MIDATDLSTYLRAAKEVRLAYSFPEHYDPQQVAAFNEGGKHVFDRAVCEIVGMAEEASRRVGEALAEHPIPG
mgnify:CR=1 FL=1